MLLRIISTKQAKLEIPTPPDLSCGREGDFWSVSYKTKKSEPLKFYSGKSCLYENILKTTAKYSKASEISKYPAISG